MRSRPQRRHQACARLKPPGRYQLELPPPVPQLSIWNWSATPARSTTVMDRQWAHEGGW